MTVTDYVFNNSTISYEITETGYRIYLNGTLWITQEGNDYHCLVPNGTFEDSCIEHIKSIADSESGASDDFKIEEKIDEIINHLNEINEYHLEIEFKNVEMDL